jgi:hypothetical protein
MNNPKTFAEFAIWKTGFDKGISAVVEFTEMAKREEQERIIKLINDTAGEICGNSVHIINGSCLCDLIVRIKGENK